MSTTICMFSCEARSWITPVCLRDVVVDSLAYSSFSTSRSSKPNDGGLIRRSCDRSFVLSGPGGQADVEV